MGSVRSDGCDLYYEEMGEGVPILLIHPSGATASTWGSAVEELARIGRVISYDRRGYARSGGEPVRSMSTHTADAAAILESLQTPPAVVVGTSAGAAIAVDLAVRRPDLVRVVIAHEFPWRFTRHLPTGSQVAALAKIGSLALRGRHGDATEVLLRSAYTYRDGGSAWDAFPEEWRRVARENARAALADFRNSIVHLSIRDGSRDRRGPRRVHLRRTEPEQHGRSRPFACRGDPHCDNSVKLTGPATQPPSTQQPTSCRSSPTPSPPAVAAGGGLKYQMRETMFAIGDDYWIETDAGQRAFKVDGKALRIRKTLILETPEGDEVFTIQKKLLSIRDTMEIERDGKTVATVMKALITPLRDRFSIEVEGGEDMEAKGNIVDHEYEIERGGEKVAEVSKRWFRMRDTYGIEIADVQNDALILAVTVCIDQMSHNVG